MADFGDQYSDLLGGNAGHRSRSQPGLLPLTAAASRAVRHAAGGPRARGPKPSGS